MRAADGGARRRRWKDGDVMLLVRRGLRSDSCSLRVLGIAGICALAWRYGWSRCATGGGARRWWRGRGGRGCGVCALGWRRRREGWSCSGCWRGPSWRGGCRGSGDTGCIGLPLLGLTMQCVGMDKSACYCWRFVVGVRWQARARGSGRSCVFSVQGMCSRAKPVPFCTTGLCMRKQRPVSASGSALRPTSSRAGCLYVLLICLAYMSCVYVLLICVSLKCLAYLSHFQHLRAENALSRRCLRALRAALQAATQNIKRDRRLQSVLLSGLFWQPLLLVLA